MPSERTCIVIGAGLSGLACAADLVKAGFQVTVLEARNRIGGRTHTLSDPASGTVLDLGGSFIHGIAGNPLYAIAQARNLRLAFPGHAGAENHTQVYSSEGPLLPVELAKTLASNASHTFFESSGYAAQDSSQTYPAATDSLSSFCMDDHRTTLHRGLRTELDKERAAAILNSFNDWIGGPLSDTSLRYWRSDINFGGGPDAVLVDGYAGIYTPLADAVRNAGNGSNVILEAEVISVELAKEAEGVVVQTKSTSGADKRIHRASFCVCTLPLGVLTMRPPVFVPALPKRRIDAALRIGQGLLNKIIVTYPTCFWPEEESVFTLLPSAPSEAFVPLLRHRAIDVMNYKPITGKNQLVMFCGADFGKAIEALSDDYIAKSVHAIFMHHFSNGAKSDGVPHTPDGVIVTRWLRDPFACGSYTYVRKAQGGEAEVPTPFDYCELGRPQWGGRLGFAGEATDAFHYVSKCITAVSWY